MFYFVRVSVNSFSSSPSSFSSKLKTSLVGICGGINFLERTASELIRPIQGWNNTSFNPFKEPIRSFAFF